LAVGCIPRQPPKVFQAVTNTAPPCWHEICPGVTSRQEVLEILGSLPEVDQSQVVELSIYPPASGTGWRFDRSQARGFDAGECVYQDDTVVYCYFGYGGSGLRLKHVLDEFGDPKRIVPIVQYADHRWLVVFLVYPDVGFGLAYVVSPWTSDEIEVNPNTKVRGCYLFSPEQYVELLGEPFGLLGFTREAVEGAQRPWLGYGTFELDVP
jgi:hypothetical protein